MFCITIDPVEAFFFMRGETHHLSEGGGIFIRGRAWMRMTKRDGAYRRLIIDRYLYLQERHPDLVPSPTEWTRQAPMGTIVGSAVFGERTLRGQVELNPVERMILQLKPYVYPVQDYQPLPAPVPHKGKGVIFTVDDDLNKIYNQTLTDTLLRDFYDLLLLVDKMKNPFVGAAQEQIRRHPGFKIRQVRWSGPTHTGLLQFLYGKGWTVVRNPPWRKTFAERFPGFEV